MTWRTEEEDIEIILKSQTVTGKQKFLVNNGGDTIRKIVIIGDRTEFKMNQFGLDASSTSCYFNMMKLRYPRERRLTLNLSKEVHSAYIAGKNERTVVEIVNTLATELIEAYRMCCEFFDDRVLERNESRTLYLFVAAPRDSGWTQFASLGLNSQHGILKLRCGTSA